jgi:Domain of unknown function (DUF397)
MSIQSDGQSVLIWRKSSASADVGNCVEVACADSAVLVRDSHDQSGPMLEFTPTLWHSFVRRIRGDQSALG